MNLAYVCLERVAQRIPGRPALIDCESGAVTSYGELNARVNAVANALVAMGVVRGDRVAVYLPNIPDYVVIVMAIRKTTRIQVPIRV